MESECKSKNSLQGSDWKLVQKVVNQLKNELQMGDDQIQTRKGVTTGKININITPKYEISVHHNKAFEHILDKQRESHALSSLSELKATQPNYRASANKSQNEQRKSSYSVMREASNTTGNLQNILAKRAPTALSRTNAQNRGASLSKRLAKVPSARPGAG